MQGSEAGKIMNRLGQFVTVTKHEFDVHRERIIYLEDEIQKLKIIQPKDYSQQIHSTLQMTKRAIERQNAIEETLLQLKEDFSVLSNKVEEMSNKEVEKPVREDECESKADLDLEKDEITKAVHEEEDAPIPKEEKAVLDEIDEIDKMLENEINSIDKTSKQQSKTAVKSGLVKPKASDGTKANTKNQEEN